VVEPSSASAPGSTSSGPSEADEHKRRVAEVFGRAADAYGTVVDFFDHFGRRLADRAGLQPGMHVLDVAAGKGASAFPAAEAVGPSGHVLAVDLTTEMIQHLRADATRRGVANLECAVMDGEHLQVDDHSFDAVLCGFGLFFFHDPGKGAREFRRVVRPRGRVACSMPLKTFPDHVMALRKEFAPRGFTGDIHTPGPHFDGAAVLREAGFEDVATEDETAEFAIDGRDGLWDLVLASGARDLVDRLSPGDAAEFEARVKAGAPDGRFTETMSARFWLASG